MKSQFLYAFFIILLNSYLIGATGLPNTDDVDYKFKHYGVNDGLTQTTILTIEQDHNGFMWIGTRNGLNRYDGYSFVQYLHQPNDSNSIPANRIDIIKEDALQRLWIGSAEGLCLYNWQTDNFIRIPVFDNGKRVQKPVGFYRISVDKNNTIWATSPNSVYKYNEQAKHLEKVALTKNSSKINYYYHDREGNSYLATNQGLFINGTPPTGILTGYSKAIYQSDDNEVWFGTPSFLNKINVNTSEIEQFDILSLLPEQGYVTIRDIIEGRPGKLWCGTYYGILIFDIATRHFEKLVHHNPNNLNSLSDNSITNMFRDKHNSYWVGTFSGGLNFLENENIDFKHYKQIPFSSTSLNSNVISAFCEAENGDLLIGTGRGGLNILNQNTKLVKHYFTDYNVREIIQLENKRFLLGTYKNGLILLDSEYNLIQHFLSSNPGLSLNRNFIFSLYQDSRNRIWVATSMRLFQWNSQSNNFLPYQLPGESHALIYEIKETKSYGLVLCSRLGLLMYRENRNDFKLILPITSEGGVLPGSIINSFMEDSRNILWVATNKGLVKFTPKQNKYEVLTEHKGLSTNNILSVLEDDAGNIWLGTGNGLNKINYTDSSILHYDISNGLQGNEFRRNAAIKLKSGDLAFGGGNGLNIFNPLNLNFNSIPPEIVFTGLVVNGELVLPGDKSGILKTSIIKAETVNLNHTSKSFIVMFSAINYKSTYKNKYAYYLEGFDEKWNYVNGQREAKYTSLKPGEYVLHVKAANNDGVWNEKGNTISILIKPSFWQTKIFIVLVILVAIALFILIYKVRLQTIKHQKNILAKRVKKRTAELAELNEELEEQKNTLKVQNEEILTSNEKIVNQNRIIQEHVQELEAHRCKLEELVKARTLELEEAILQARKADKLKSSFLANMSHEIRTPLNAILGFTEVLFNQDVEEFEKNSIMKIIRSSSESLVRLIDDILDFSRIEADQLNLNLNVFNLNSLLLNLKKSFEEENNDKYKKDIILRLTCIPDSEDIVIHTDNVRLKQVLVNLLSNALKFTETGTIEFGYEVKENHIQFFVKDEGIGISEEGIDGIFEQFRKIESKTKLYRGTGLGLAISKKIVELLGGQIRVESQPDIGSVFYFTIPKSVIVNTEQLPLESISHTTNTDWSKYSILIAEDEDDNFELLQYYLKGTTVNVIRAANGQEAVEIVENNHNINLVLMDLKMPVMNGYDAFEKIRKMKGSHQLPVIAQTAYALKTDEQKIAVSGFDDYLTKPISRELLIGLVTKYLK